MNVVLFQKNEVDKPLSRRDNRAKHILKVLRLSPGEKFKMGIVGSNMGMATLKAVSEKEISFTVELGDMPESLHPLTLIAGFVRPNSVKRILRDATSLGVERIIWTPTELTEKSYRNSHIWDPSYQEPLLLEGAIQAYSSLIPEIIICENFEEAMSYGAFDKSIALDHIRADRSLSSLIASRELQDKKVRLAIGSERGWTENERKRLTEEGFLRASMGSRVLRTDTAFMGGIAMTLAGMDKL